ncbi:unnamed protein product [Somion occarium]|uniref:non-specific serine/threonine protein kinase n=1 Tax=Somion occarium TaxID=3059160 RepID=A0ABP1DXM0_9APHY
MHAVKRLCLLRRFSTAASARLQSTKNTMSQSSTQPANAGWEGHEEKLEDYDPGSIKGYCPVVPGDVLGSYRIFRKLGWGGYSTVWLAESQGLSNPDLSALKLMTSVATKEQERLCELEFLQRIRDQSSVHPGYAHVLQMKDNFYHQGPHGQHLCIVTEPLFHNMHRFSLRFPHRIMPLRLVRSISRQIVLGLQYLHDECNIIYTDIKPDNVLMIAPNGQNFFRDNYAELHNPLETSIVTSPTGAAITLTCSDPIYYPLPTVLSTEDDIWLRLKVKISDLGVACWADKVSQHHTECIQSTALRAPEVAIGAGWGKPADIWSLGCTIYELYMGRPLIPADVDELLVAPLHGILFGQYPEALVKRGKHSHFFFNPDGSFKETGTWSPFDSEIRRRNAPDAEHFIDFLRLTFELDPDRRATCGDLLAHPWLDPENWDTFRSRKTQG